MRRMNPRTAIAPRGLSTTATQQLHKTHGDEARATNTTRKLLLIAACNLRVHIAPLPPMLPIWVASVGAPAVGLTIKHKRGGAKSAV